MCNERRRAWDWLKCVNYSWSIRKDFWAYLLITVKVVLMTKWFSTFFSKLTEFTARYQLVNAWTCFAEHKPLAYPGRSATGAPPNPQTVYNSFVFAYVFAKKCQHRRLVPPQRLGVPPTGNPGSYLFGSLFSLLWFTCCLFIYFLVIWTFSGHLDS